MLRSGEGCGCFRAGRRQWFLGWLIRFAVGLAVVVVVVRIGGRPKVEQRQPLAAGGGYAGGV
jgi:hypothetical protein